MQADVFTKTPLEGNPCAVVFDADGLSERVMLAVAKEMNLSETVFITRSKRCDFRPRYFTPKEEIPLAGHPTIATVHCLIETGRIRPSARRRSVSLQLAAGDVRVDIEPASRGREIVMHQLPPRFLRTYAAHDVLPLFGLGPSDWLGRAPIQTVSTGTPMLMIPLRSLAALRRAELRVREYVAFKKRGDFFSPHLFCLRGITFRGDTFARHFGVPPDTFEDPFTGSASGSMAAYLWRYGLIRRPLVTAEQGHWMGRPGRARLEVVGPRDRIETVKLRGTAVTVMKGALLL